MGPDDTDRFEAMDTIPAPPPSHIDPIAFAAPQPLKGLVETDDSGVFAFALDCEFLDED